MIIVPTLERGEFIEHKTTDDLLQSPARSGRIIRPVPAGCATVRARRGADRGIVRAGAVDGRVILRLCVNELDGKGWHDRGDLLTACIVGEFRSFLCRGAAVGEVSILQ